MKSKIESAAHIRTDYTPALWQTGTPNFVAQPHGDHFIDPPRRQLSIWQKPRPGLQELLEHHTGYGNAHGSDADGLRLGRIAGVAQHIIGLVGSSIQSGLKCANVSHTIDSLGTSQT